MNAKTLISSLAFGLVSANALAVEALPFEIPATTLDRAEVRAQIARSDIRSDETYGSFSYRELHGLRQLTREAVIAEMSMPKWQALMAARSDEYNSFGHVGAPGTSLAAAASEAAVAARAGAFDYVGG